MGELGDGSAITNSALRVFRNRPHYRFEGRLHEQIAHHLPTYAAGRIEQTLGPGRPLRLPRRGPRRQGEVAAATSSCSAPSRPRAPRRLPALQPRHRVRRDRRPRRRADRVRARLAADQSRGEEANDYVPALVQRLVAALRATAGGPSRPSREPKRGCSASRVHRPRVRPGAGLATAGPRGRRDRLLGAVHRDGRRPRALRRDDRRAAPTCPRIALAELYMRRGDTGPGPGAARLVRRRDTPTSSGSIDPYATVLLRGGVAPDTAVAEIETRVGDLTPAARFILASSLYRGGAMLAAETQFRAVLAARPTSSQVRVRLAEALLNQRRYADAAEESAQIDDANRTPAWPRGSSCGAGSPAVTRGRRRGLSPRRPGRRVRGRAEVFPPGSSWPGRTAQAPRSLPVAGDADAWRDPRVLLRPQDFETFERLIPLLRGSALPGASSTSSWPRCTWGKGSSPRPLRSGWRCASSGPTPAHSSAWPGWPSATARSTTPQCSPARPSSTTRATPPPGRSSLWPHDRPHSPPAKVGPQVLRAALDYPA